MKKLISALFIISAHTGFTQTDTCDIVLQDLKVKYICDRSGGEYNSIHLLLAEYKNPPYTFDFGGGWAGSLTAVGEWIQVPFGDSTTVYVYDKNGCSVNFKYTSDNGIKAKANVVDASCALCPDGSIEAEITEGDTTEVLFIRWQDPQLQVGMKAENLTPGFYYGYVAYGDDCSELIGDTIGLQTSIEQFDDYNIKIHPNPSTNYLSISGAKLSLIKSISLIDLSGKVISVQEIKNGSNQFTLDVSGFPNGAYIIKLNGNAITLTESLIIE